MKKHKVSRGKQGRQNEAKRKNYRQRMKMWKYCSRVLKDKSYMKYHVSKHMDKMYRRDAISVWDIAIPVISGGTYSPDFMYVVKRNDGKKEQIS